MARRSGGRLTAVLTAALLVSCSAPAGTATVGAPTPATTLPPSTTAPSHLTSTTVPAEPEVEVGLPEGAGPFPSVVLVHGGGWVAGDPSSMRPLARFLNDSGFLTVNTRYALSSRESPGFPEALEDVACAVRLAGAHPESDGTVAVVGHSAGAHIAALVALDGDDYLSSCPITEGPVLPQRLVGLAGPYDVSRLGSALGVFFGASLAEDPDTWLAGNPLELVAENPELEALIMYGENDGLVADLFAVGFHTALTEAGVESLLELIEGARHNDMHDPEVVGDLIVTWLRR